MSARGVDNSQNGTKPKMTPGKLVFLWFVEFVFIGVTLYVASLIHQIPQKQAKLAATGITTTAIVDRSTSSSSLGLANISYDFATSSGQVMRSHYVGVDISTYYSYSPAFSRDGPDTIQIRYLPSDPRVNLPVSTKVDIWMKLSLAVLVVITAFVAVIVIKLGRQLRRGKFQA